MVSNGVASSSYHRHDTIRCLRVYTSRHMFTLGVYGTGSDLPPGSPGFDHGWKNGYPVWKFVEKVQPGSFFDPG